jgi:geranylgeranyl pyrophosphate synthase
MTPLDRYLAETRRVVEDALRRALPADAAPRLIIEPMEYALLDGGKRLRPALTLATAGAVAEHLGIAEDVARALALPNACAVELVHTYSLVHDDLPAMDDDVLRRGRATTHVVYGDGLAILVGDGLLTEAFVLIAKSMSPVLPAGSPIVPVAARLRSIEILATAAGVAGMVGGQAIDLVAADRGPQPGVSLDESGLRDMHARKTGALIRAAAALGAVAVGADEPTTEAVDDYARELGLAFQIIDDVLDVDGDASELGKTAGKDAAAAKLTYPALHGLETSRQLAAACVDRAKAALARAALGGHLAALADWSLTRRR